jgi:competence protein ComEA
MASLARLAMTHESLVGRRAAIKGSVVNRAVGAAVLIGMICLGGMLSNWTIREQPLARDSLAISLPDPARNTTLITAPRAHVARAPAISPPSFASDPLAFLSRAPADSLDLLPGIGPVLAARIVAARSAFGGGFASWDEVDRVKGIGPTMIARWRALSARQ